MYEHGKSAGKPLVRKDGYFVPAEGKSGRQRFSLKNQEQGASMKTRYCDIDGDGAPDTLLRNWRNPAVGKVQSCDSVAAQPLSGPSNLNSSFVPVAPLVGPSNLSSSLVPPVPLSGPSNLSSSLVTWTPAEVDAVDMAHSFTAQTVDGTLTAADDLFTTNGIGVGAGDEAAFWDIQYGSGTSLKLENALDTTDPGIHLSTLAPHHVPLDGVSEFINVSRPRENLAEEGSIFLVISTESVVRGTFLSFVNSYDHAEPQLKLKFTSPTNWPTRIQVMMELSNGVSPYKNTHLLAGTATGGALGLTLIRVSWSWITNDVDMLVLNQQSIDNDGQTYPLLSTRMAGSTPQPYGDFDPYAQNFRLMDIWGCIGGDLPIILPAPNNELQRRPANYYNLKVHEYTYLKTVDETVINNYECYLNSKWGTYGLPTMPHCSA